MKIWVKSWLLTLAVAGVALFGLVAPLALGALVLVGGLVGG